MSTTRTRTSGEGQRQGRRGASRRPPPQRTCAACRRVGDQSSFVRLVRVTSGPDGAETPAGVTVEVDEGRRRIAGRGAYLCREASCWERGLKGALAGSLRASIDEISRERLRQYGAQFASTATTDSSDEDSDQHEGEDA